MGHMTMYQMTVEDLANEADMTKDNVLACLVCDGLLSAEDAERWSRTHTIILKKPSRISRWYAALVGKEEPERYRRLVAEIPELMADDDDCAAS